MNACFNCQHILFQVWLAFPVQRLLAGPRNRKLPSETFFYPCAWLKINNRMIYWSAHLLAD